VIAIFGQAALVVGNPFPMMRPGTTVPGWNVAEIQGLYGPFAFSERLLQKIWLRGEFDPVRAITEDGRALQVWHPGRWNLLGGPDFRQARLSLGGEIVTGDVELHLYAGDWAAHGHAADPAYAGVVLHVVLFPPSPGEVARHADGSALSTLVLLPLLLHGLEEYAEEETIERLADRGSWRAAEELAALPPAEMRALLLCHAEGRWRQKVQFARRRVERLGWPEACHHTALEILGYRFNRVAMLRVAIRVPLARWSAGGLEVDELFESERTAWSLQGVRPANHPRVRLRQYAAWFRGGPAWPDRLERLATTVPCFAIGADPHRTTTWRKRWTLPLLRDRFQLEVAAGSVTGTRLDNLACDGFLPLLSAHAEHDHSGAWFHWYAGDLPLLFRPALRSLGLFGDGLHPACHGYAQGLLGWLLARESSTTAAPAPAAVGAPA
jgi:Protein of unknown function (DUF2851)